MSLRFGAIVVDSGRGDVWLGERRVRLPKQRFDIFCLLWKAKGKPVRCGKLTRNLYCLRPDCDVPTSNVVAKQISILRQELLPLGFTVSRGFDREGYRLEWLPEASALAA